MKHGSKFYKGGLEHAADLCEVCALLLPKKQKQRQLLATKNMAVVTHHPYLLALISYDFSYFQA